MFSTVLKGTLFWALESFEMTVKLQINSINLSHHEILKPDASQICYNPVSGGLLY